MSARLKIFTWPVHGRYLYYLSKGDYDIYIPFDKSKADGNTGKTAIPFADNVHEVVARDVKQLEFDCILFQSSKNYLIDQHLLFSPEQHSLPKVYLEHDPPRNTPTDSCHIVEDPDIPLVHVTHFNNVMWNNNHTPTLVIEHGVIDSDVKYSGHLEKGIVVINDIARRGRRVGLDIFLEVRKQVPLDIVGKGSEEVGGLGEVLLADLPEFISEYRFFFNPVRFTSLDFSVCEAMMAGMPIIGMATGEMPSVIQNGKSGFVHNNLDEIIRAMERLMEDKSLAMELGGSARKSALKRFNIERFTKNWLMLFTDVVTKKYPYKNSLVHL